LGTGQSFGDEEITLKSTIRKSKAVVKSLTAEVLVLPIEV